jgi:hypothetical protein
MPNVTMPWVCAATSHISFPWSSDTSQKHITILLTPINSCTQYERQASLVHIKYVSPWFVATLQSTPLTAQEDPATGDKEQQAIAVTMAEGGSPYQTERKSITHIDLIRH